MILLVRTMARLIFAVVHDSRLAVPEAAAAGAVRRTHSPDLAAMISFDVAGEAHQRKME